MARFVVGLRGGIGTGKSTVSDLFEAKGIVVADADISSRAIFEIGEPAYNQVVNHFGEQILAEDNSIDRAELRRIIFADAAERAVLESMTHRPIIEHLQRTIVEAKSEYAILVLSTGLGKSTMMQRLLVVDAPRESQIERVMARDHNSLQQVESILAAQPDRETRVAEADDLIVNDGEINALVIEVDKLHVQYLEMAKTHG